MPLFPSVETELEYLEKEGLDGARIQVLETHGKYVEAADVHLLNGGVVEAIQSCLRVEEDEAAFKYAVDIILDALWKEYSFTMPARKILKKGTTTAHILELALNLPQARLNASNGNQVLYLLCYYPYGEGSILHECFRYTSSRQCSKPPMRRSSSWGCHFLTEVMMPSRLLLSTLLSLSCPFCAPRTSPK